MRGRCVRALRKLQGKLLAFDVLYNCHSLRNVFHGMRLFSASWGGKSLRCVSRQQIARSWRMRGKEGPWWNMGNDPKQGLWRGLAWCATSTIHDDLFNLVASFSEMWIQEKCRGSHVWHVYYVVFTFVNGYKVRLDISIYFLFVRLHSSLIL